MSEQNMFIHLVAGGVAGTTGAILTCPLEVVKTRFQASCETDKEKPTEKKITPVNSKSLHNNHYHHHHQQLTLPNTTSSKFNNLNCSSTKLQCYSNILFRNSHGATTTNTSLVANTLNFETHLSHSYNQNHLNQVTQCAVNKAPNGLSNFGLGKNIILNFKYILFGRLIIENEGYRALFKGLGPNIIGVAPYRAIYFFSYANSKLFLSKKFGEERPILHVLAAFSAGFTAVSITNPIWFVKTRLQLDKSRRGSSTLQVVNKILKEKGPLGFYKGISASYFGIAESALYFVMYEKLKSMSISRMPANSDENLSLFTYFTSAGFSKTLASILCYPHEVARTRLRLEGNKYTGFFQTLNLIVHEEGMRGMYKGMATHLIRQIPNTAIVMTTYELIVNYFCTNDKSFPDD